MSSRLVCICLVCACAGQARAFSVVQYNCKGNGASNWSTNSAQVRAIGRQMMYLQPDIVTFNEIPQSRSYEMTNFVKAFLPGYYLATSPNGDSFITTSIASRYPISRYRSWLHASDLTPYGAPGYKYTRDLFEVQITVPGFAQPVHVFNSHLKAMGDNTSLKRRAAEAGAISNFIYTAYLTTNATHPYVLTGDLNEDINRPPNGSLQPIQRLVNAATGLDLTTPVNPYTGDDRTISIQTTLTKRFDYILPCGVLFSNIASSQVFRTDLLPSPPPPLLADDDITASDHLPVVMVFNAPAEPPLIVSAPQSQTAELSSNVTFTVSASGSPPLGYQWRFGANPIAGATGTSLTLTNVLFAQAGSYSVVVTNAGGAITSGPAILAVVDTIAPAITTCASNGTFAAGSDCQAVLPDLAAQVAADDASGAVTVTQDPPAGTVLGLGLANVTFIARDSSSNASTCVATVIVVDLAPPVLLAWAPEVTVAPTANCQAALADLTSTNYLLAVDNCSSVTVTQSPLPGTALGLGTTNAVTLTASDGAGNATNCVVLVVVPGMPMITAQPADISVTAGGDAAFGVAACAPGQLYYQWRFNSTPIPGATDSSYTAANAQPRDAGSYSVEVSNLAGTVTSADAVLTVIELTPPRIDLIGLLPGAQVQLQVSGGPGHYAVEASSNLVAWSDLTNLTTTNGGFRFLDSDAGESQRFYRVRLIP